MKKEISMQNISRGIREVLIWGCPAAGVLMSMLVVIGLFNESDDGAELLFLILSVFLFILSAVAGLLSHNIKPLRSPERERLIMFTVKVGLIPFYITGGGVAVGITIFPAFILISGALVVIGYGILLLTSVWSICYMLSMKKKKLMAAPLRVIFLLSQFFFVADVLAVVIVFFLYKYKHLPRQIADPHATSKQDRDHTQDDASEHIC